MFRLESKFDAPLLTIRRPGWNYSSKVFAGCTKNTSVKRRPKSRPVIATPRIQHSRKGRPLAPGPGAALGMAQRETCEAARFRFNPD